MRIVIVDDDQEFGKVLKDKLSDVFIDSKIKVFDEYIEGIINGNDDIVFLDVMLKNEESFDLGEKLSQLFPNLVLVYISSQDHFVYDSYRQKTFFFIRKSRLDRDLNDFNLKYQKLIYNQLIEVQYQNTTIKINSKDIIYVESKRNRIYIYTYYQTYEIYMSLIQFEKLLESNYFYRFNSHLLLNLNHIQKVAKEYVLLSNGTKINYTRNSKKNFIIRYASYRSGDL